MIESFSNLAGESRKRRANVGLGGRSEVNGGLKGAVKSGVNNGKRRPQRSAERTCLECHIDHQLVGQALECRSDLFEFHAGGRREFSLCTK
jgi:hypothetical protein